MNLANQIVIHKIYGEGTITAHERDYLTISFSVGEKKFIFPDAFKGFITAKDASISEHIEILLNEIEEEKRRVRKEAELRKEQEEQQKIRNTAKLPKQHKAKTYPRANIAFKCNYCDGGQSDIQIGFDGACSDAIILNNIEVENRTWCNSDDCSCLHYLNNQISRKELDTLCKGDGFVCYESQMLRDWRALAGVIQNGENRGKPMKLNQVQANSLCVLTTRDPQSKESERFIFAVFLVGEAHEGDGSDEGYVSTKSKYKIKLAPQEARSLLFWNYHANDNNPETAVWSSGLHRYFEDEQAAQILRDIASIKVGTQDDALANDFYEYFCKINGVDISALGEPHGALQNC